LLTKISKITYKLTIFAIAKKKRKIMIRKMIVLLLIDDNIFFIDFIEVDEF